MNKKTVLLIVVVGIFLLVPHQFLVPAQVPLELVVTNLVVTPSNPMDGEVMTIRATVKNMGPSPADVTVRFLVNGTKLNVGGGVPDLRLVGDLHVGLLDPGSSITRSVDTIARFGDISAVVRLVDVPGEWEFDLGDSIPPFYSYTDGDSGVTVEYTGEHKKYVTDPMADVLLINPPFERWLLLKIPFGPEIAIGPSHGPVDTMYGYSEFHGTEVSTSVTIEGTTSWGYKTGIPGVAESEISVALSKAYTESSGQFSMIFEGHDYYIGSDETSEEDVVGWHREEYNVYTYNVYKNGNYTGQINVAEDNDMYYSTSSVSYYNSINGDHGDIAGWGYEQNHEVGCVRSYDGTPETQWKTFGIDTICSYWRDTSAKITVTDAGYVKWSYKEENGWANSVATSEGVSLTLQSEIGGFTTSASISISQTTTHTVTGGSTSEFGGNAPPVDLTWGDYTYTYFPWIWWTSFGGSGNPDEFFLVVDYHVTSYGSSYNQTPSMYNIALNGGTVTGKVTDTQGNPVDGVEVTFENPTFNETAMTDPNGDYTLLGVPPGTYNVHYSPITFQKCNIPWPFPGWLDLPRPWNYTGTLVTNLGEPYPDTPLYFTSEIETFETQTDPNGNFVIDLPPGTYDVTMDGTGLAIMTLYDEGIEQTVLTSVAGNKKIANKPPIAEAGPDQMVLPGTVVILNASESSDIDGPIVDYTWDFDDGTPLGHGIVVNHTYTTPGDYNVTLTVTDEAGANSTDTVMIYVRESHIGEPVGGIVLPTDKLALLAPYIATAVAVAAITIGAVYARKRWLGKAVVQKP